MSDTKTVFVVHGRNPAARTSVFGFLRALGLKPLEWEQARKLTDKTSPYIGEVLDVAFDQAQAIVVVLSGDDEARLFDRFHNDDDPEHERNLTAQARANVIFEAGMAIGRDANRTILIEIGKLRPFSDLAGRHAVRLRRGDSAERNTIVARLRTAGCAIDDAGTDWLTQDFFGELLIANPQ
jgi:predicted nucleotide-binding protein